MILKEQRENVMKHRHVIQSIEPGSIADELGLEPGDKLISINDTMIEDVFDYHFFVNDEELTLLIEKVDGEEWELEIEKDLEEDLGIVFEQGLMDEYRSCRNKCIFCFIDQMPKGMRETLYFKDDDSRLSFLQGNYVTLTNMSEHDIDRIVRYHLEPINISFQTMNPELRCKMLNNRFAGEALKKVDTLFEAGIHMNGQIVLCKGVNDKEEELLAIAHALKEFGIAKYELLAFHQYGKGKYESCGMKYELGHLEQMSEENKNKWNAYFEKCMNE
jgi:putative radical SAM enzyme (TIGR03279 family)